MSQPFIGEIRIAGFNFIPVNWALCDGSLLPISQYEALFALIGTTFGGDGLNTFALPDLQGRVPLHQGTDQSDNVWVFGTNGGSETVTLNSNQIPVHNHLLNAQSANGVVSSPSNSYWAASSLDQFSNASPTYPMANVMESSGGGQPHDNMTPFTVLNYIIALEGIFPSRN